MNIKTESHEAKSSESTSTKTENEEAKSNQIENSDTESNEAESNEAESNKTESYGIILKILSVMCFAIMTALIKYLSGGIPLGELVFFRSTAALLPLMLFLWLNNDLPEGLHTSNPWGHIKRCVLGSCAMFSSFKALEFLPIAEATALGYLSPMFMILLSVFLLKETVTVRRWLGVAFGISGLLLMTLPKFNMQADKETLMGLALGLIGALFISVAMLQVRQLNQMGERAGTIAFYFTITSASFGAIAMIGHWVTPTFLQLMLLLSIGLVGGVAQILMTLAFKYAEASALATYDYLAIVWAVIIGFTMFDEIPDLMFWLAVPLILMGAIIAKPVAKKATTPKKL